MVKEFKFFYGFKQKINWEVVGLLDGAVNVRLLTSVLDITYRYLRDNDLINDEFTVHILFPTITRLYRDKYHSYSDDHINFNIDVVINHLCSPDISRYIRDIRTNSWTSIDVEAEISTIIYERCKWEEDYGF
jgi:hypothetical protein